MDENDIKSALDKISVSAIPLALDQLFNTAKSRDFNSYSKAIKGLSKWKDYRVEERIIQQMTQHYADFYSWLKTDTIKSEKVRYMLQLINYGLFWENVAVQRLLCSLVDVVNTGTYSEPIFNQTDHNTCATYEKLISDSKRATLEIASVIEALYNNQIRNATVHAQIYFYERGITLMNHKQKSVTTIPSISYDIWHDLYGKTNIFIELLFSKRLNEYKVVN
jgi:hypothetical protein